MWSKLNAGQVKFLDGSFGAFFEASGRETRSLATISGQCSEARSCPEISGSVQTGRSHSKSEMKGAKPEPDCVG